MFDCQITESSLGVASLTGTQSKFKISFFFKTALFNFINKISFHFVITKAIFDNVLMMIIKSILMLTD